MSPSTSGQSGSYQDILFLGVSRPIVIRLHLLVDGMPFVGVWEEYVRQLFDLADGDKDGRLSPGEIEFPASSTSSLWDETLALLTTPGLLQADANPPDGSLSFEEFVAFARQHRGGAFQPPPDVVSNAVFVTRAANVDEQINPGRILFDSLDLDKDGQVTREELAVGPESIGKLDFDGDGASSIDELNHVRGAFGRGGGNPEAVADVPLRVLASTTPTNELIASLSIARRSPRGVSAADDPALGAGSGLTASQLGFTDEELAAFDADGNKRLDREELRYWLTHPQPHVELVVRVGQRGADVEAVTVKGEPALADLTVKRSEGGLLNVVSGDVHLEVGVGSDRRSEESVRSAFTKSFERADQDGNRYLDRDEAADNALFESSFTRFDRDSDGKMFADEMLEVVEEEIIAGLSRTAMTTANRGKDLFEILDSNRDSRVSRRELLAAEGRFSLWDTDVDDRLSEREVPQLYQLVFDRGTPRLAGLNLAGSQTAVTGETGRSGTLMDTAPIWFRKMDRNGDGDVALREFLGTADQFDQLDADDNELIGAFEAAAEAVDQTSAD